jgi:predicted Zn-dependent protease
MCEEASMRKTVSSVVLVLIFAVVAAGCAVNPATGKRQLSLISNEREVQIGRESDREIQQSLGVYDDVDLQAYIQSFGQRLAANSERPDLDWQFRVVDDATVNAFALPGGYIYITRGIMAHLNSEAELSAVVGHEIGHVTARHSVNQMSKAQLAGIGLNVATVVASDYRQLSDLAQTGMSLLFLKYSRDDERQADDLGMRYTLRASYDPRPTPSIYRMLDRVSEAQGATAIPALVATHPDPLNRATRIEQAIAGLDQDLSGLSIDQARYFDQLDGMVFGQDPREGFFHGDTFMHPDLKFVFAFPVGWSMTNARAAVAGVSGAQDAMIKITMASESTVDQALRAFLDDDGVGAGASWSGRINGLPTAAREFRAYSDQGNLKGIAAFVEYNNAIYRMVGFSIDTGWEDYAPTIKQSLSSFNRLTNQAALEVEPKRLRIVRVDEAIDLQTFARKHQASVPVETLALINNVDEGAMLEAGRSYKVVTGGEGP